MPKPDGGPAFARSIGHGTVIFGGNEQRLEVAPQRGMTLRDWFAGQALTSALSASASDGSYDYVAAAIAAYAIADAMLAEREK